MASLIYKTLLQRKVKDVFLYSGGAIMPLVDKFHRSPIKYYINSNELCTGLTAVGYAKSISRSDPSVPPVPGVCIVTSGPGLTNLVTAITDAQNDRTPLIVLSGQVSRGVYGTDAFQECPATSITKSITNWSSRPTNMSELYFSINNAFDLATEGKAGVAHIDLHKDLLLSEEEPPPLPYTRILNKPGLSVDPNIKHIASLINKSQKPIIIAGKGAIPYSYPLRRLMMAIKSPLTTTIHAMGIINEDHPLVFPFMGMHGSPAANYLVQNSDCIINIGSRFDDRILGNPSKFAPNAKYIIDCNIGKDDLGKTLLDSQPVDKYIPVNMDAGVFLKALLSHITDTANSRRGWHTYLNRLKKLPSFSFRYNKAPHPIIKTQDVMVELNKQMKPRQTIITTGVGNHQMMAAQYINWEYPQRFITSGSLGAMGAGLPYAIGAQIANRDKIIIDIDGDGSFNQTYTDLKMLVEYKLPVKVIVLDDGELSMVKTWEELFYCSRHVATQLTHNPDYVALAKAHGIDSLLCDNIDDLPRAIRAMLDTDLREPFLLHIKVRSDRCLPLVPPGNALDDIMTLKM